MEELFNDEWAQESGTHSILDVYRVLDDGERPDYGTVEPVSAAEALRHAGTERLTRPLSGRCGGWGLRTGRWALPS
ncbi:hypothetical protein [Micromonospora sp. B9E7]|uniref:hypothetical protein n=1 Tax=Micromonospora sp. B9E7 TaxID=3153574 RepID=UPI00325C6562